MWLLVRKLFIIETIVIALTSIVWAITGDGTLASFSVYLFRMGVATVTFGLIIVIGAGVGTRVESLAYLKPTSTRRLQGDLAHRRRSYSALNLLAMAGFVALILAVLLGELGQ